MKVPRLIQGLAVMTIVLLALVLFIFYRQVPRSKTPFAKAMDHAAKIVLRKGPDKVELDAQGKDWKVRSPSGDLLAVDADKMKSFLSGLRGVSVEDPISDRADREGDFETTLDSGMRVSVLSAQGSTVADGLFGKQAPDFTHIYFRYPDEPAVYLAQGMIRGDLGEATVGSWRSHDLVTLPEAKIQSVVITGKGFKTDLKRSSDTWSLNGKVVNPGPVYGLVGQLAHLRASDFVDPFKYPGITFESLSYAQIQVASPDEAITLHIGPEDPVAHLYPASLAKENGIAWLSEPTVTTLVRKPSDFQLPHK